MRPPPRIVGEGSLSSAHRRIEGAAVEQQVLSDDKSGRSSAQKGAGVAELLGIANPAGRVRRPALPQHLLERDILTPRLVFDAGAQPVRQKRAGEKPVDRDVVLCDLARETGAERGQPGA